MAVQKLSDLTGLVQEAWEISNELTKKLDDIYAKCPDMDWRTMFAELEAQSQGFEGVLVAIVGMIDK